MKKHKKVLLLLLVTFHDLNFHIPYKMLIDFFCSSYVIYLNKIYTESG